MRSLLNFLYKYHFFILFLLLEGVAFFLVIQYNNYHRATFLNSSSNISGRVLKSYNNVSQYFNLREENERLNAELAKFKSLSREAYKKNKISITEIYDSVFVQHYSYIPTKVISNSINKQNNYLTLNAGRNQGIGEGMAVVSGSGVVGVVKDVSNNFSAVISLLNQNFRISAMLKKNNYFGSLRWDGLDYRYGVLYDLPNHLQIEPGDTVITSGYSAIFPKGVLIGLVNEVGDSKGGDFIEVKVKFSVDFKNIENVLVVKNLLKKEQILLEKKAQHD